ncbi:thiosulfate sulfurtransferase-like isoform X2 [Ruditapes philippinarum]|uniref:thiosulfate sulfurtransferase-like isoform X2 n=1 Tax=Ruditapes philippinarum TaxID=129788 RepID=UPI00295A7661|nr:thiosulfate sulfurtransferase-like isoform X2 [Ruditapes philippinarum]
MTISRTALVVSTNWLREQLGNNAKNQISKKLRVLDTSFLKNKEVDTYSTCYLQEHIPQSVYFGLHNCVESTPELPRNLPDPKCFSQYVQTLGIHPDTHIVAYDRFGPTPAFRAWWLFRLYGHKKVSVLDGGLRKWIADGFETTQDLVTVEPSEFEASLDKSLIRSYDDMVRNTETKKEQVLDARSKDDNTVINKLDGGVIPGAKHIPFEDLFNSDGTFKSETEIKTMFDSAGVNFDAPMVASCFTGMTACGIAAAAYTLGKDIPIYYGSWTEWRQRAPEELKHRYKV